MSAPRLVQAQQRNYTVVADLTTVYRALVTGIVEDEITSDPVRAPLTVRVENEAIDVRILDGGSFGLAGYTERALPSLENTDYELEITIEAPGYRATSLLVHVPHQSVLPVVAEPVQLRRLPVRLQGRVVEDTSARAPVPDATITTVAGPSASPSVALLSTPLHFDHAAGVSLRECSLPVTGTPKTALTDAAAGTRTVMLDNRAGLAINAVLRLGPATAHEHALIESLDALPADLGQPGRVTLRSPLSRSLAAGAAVRHIAPVITVGGEVRTLDQEALAGEGLIILNNFIDVAAVEVTDPDAARVEYHALGAVTDVDGYYRVDGVSRVRAIDLDASAAGLQPLANPVPFTINYEQPVNVVNFRLQP